MKVRLTRVFMILSVLTFYLFLPNTVNGNTDIGLAISGPLLNQTFEVTHGQTVTGYLRVQNTGASECVFGFASVITSGPLGSLIVENPASTDYLAPNSIVQANWTFHVTANASGLVVLRITVTATGSNSEDSQVSASVSGDVHFLIDADACTADVRVIDQYGWPIQNAEVELVKERVAYVTQKTNLNGSTRFRVTKAVYTLRLFYLGVLHKTASLNIDEPRLFTFQVNRQVVRIGEPPVINLAEIAIGYALGFVVATLTIRRTNKRKRKANRTLEEEWLKWSEAPLD